MENSIYCLHCGASLRPTARFCSKCGKSQQPAPAAPPVQPAQAPVPQGADGVLAPTAKASLPDDGFTPAPPPPPPAMGYTPVPPPEETSEFDLDGGYDSPKSSAGTGLLRKPLFWVGCVGLLLIVCCLVASVVAYRAGSDLLDFGGDFEDILSSVVPEFEDLATAMPEFEELATQMPDVESIPSLIPELEKLATDLPSLDTLLTPEP